MTDKKFSLLSFEYGLFEDNETGKGFDMEKCVDVLNDLAEEIGQLKQSVNNLKETILKITVSYQRKHGNTIVDLVDEVHEEDITDLIKELKNDWKSI